MNMTQIKKICIISYSNISQDARVLRQIEYLSKFYKLVVIGHGDQPADFSCVNQIEWIRIKRRKKSIVRKATDVVRILRYGFGMVDRPDVLRTAINNNCDAYLANNWDTLPIAAIAARTNKAKLVLDIHESLQTASSQMYSDLNKKIVKQYSTQIDASTTVVNAIAEDYKTCFGFTPNILRNIPQIPIGKQVIKITDKNHIQLISHGVASHQRGTDLLIKTIALCDPRYKLHLMFINKESKYVEYLQKLAKQIAPGRAFFHPPCSPMEIVNMISTYDVGFFPLLPTNYNNHIALPNKFFDFIAARLAICIGPSPSMAEIVKKYCNGVVSPSFEPIDLANLLNQTSAFEWDKMKRASIEASKELNADIEMQKLINIFENLIQ